MKTKIKGKRAAKTGQLELPVPPWQGARYGAPHESGSVAYFPSRDAASAAPREWIAEIPAGVSEPDSAPPLPLVAEHTLPIDPTEVQRWWREARAAVGSPAVPDLPIGGAWGAALVLRHSRYPRPQTIQRAIEVYLRTWAAAQTASPNELHGGPDIEVLVRCYARLVDSVARGQDPGPIIVRAHALAAAERTAPNTPVRPNASPSSSTSAAPPRARSAPETLAQAAVKPKRPRSDRDRMLDFARRYGRGGASGGTGKSLAAP